MYKCDQPSWAQVFRAFPLQMPGTSRFLCGNLHVQLGITVSHCCRRHIIHVSMQVAFLIKEFEHHAGRKASSFCELGCVSRACGSLLINGTKATPWHSGIFCTHLSSMHLQGHSHLLRQFLTSLVMDSVMLQVRGCKACYCCC